MADSDVSEELLEKRTDVSMGINGYFDLNERSFRLKRPRVCRQMNVCFLRLA